MGVNQSNTKKSELQSGNVIDSYPIKLNTEQMANLYELLKVKKTLTWKDVVQNEKITFRKCIEVKIDVGKLHSMQPNLEEWLKYKKVEMKDCKDMELWRPNPFQHFNCHIGDLVMERKNITPRVLLLGGVRFNILWERYGLRPEHMVLLKYSAEDWVRMGLEEEYLCHFNEKQWCEIFQNLKKSELIDAIHFYKRQMSSIQ